MAGRSASCSTGGGGGGGAGGGGAAGGGGSASSRVHVVVRVRPPLVAGGDGGAAGGGGGDASSSSSSSKASECMRVLDHRSLEFLNYRNKDESLHYEFDSLHGGGASQDEVYGGSVRPVIRHVVRHGHNASVLAYGPTGAGKTHTMLGTPSEPGVIPRAVRDLFSELKGEQGEASFSVSMSYLEIYQEKVLDLLTPHHSGSKSGGGGGGGGGGGDLAIRQDGAGSMLVPGLSERPLTGFRDFERHFLPATERRTTASTALNARSSRSHSILLLKVVKSEQQAPFRTLLGKLYLIDLAGSEDNRRTGNMGIRLKESGAINGSLLVLSKVVDALNSGSARVPYRDSKLTRLLQDSLGGSAHAVLITNVAPELPHYFNSLNALNFAAKSRSIVNRPFTHSAPQPAAPAAPSKLGRVQEETPRDAERRRDKEREPPLPKAFLSPLLQRQNAFETDIELRMGRLESVILRVQNSAPHTPRGERARALPLIQGMKMQPLKPLNLDPESNRGAGKVKRQAIVAPLVAHNSVDKHPVKRKRSKLDEALVDDKSAVVVSLPDELELKRRILCKLNEGGRRCLMELQKIGKKRAELLLGWRVARGPFTRIEDLENVEGMTPKWVESFIKANLLVQI